MDRQENWKQVPGFENFYIVSDMGRLISLRFGKIIKVAPKWDKRKAEGGKPVAVKVSLVGNGAFITKSFSRLVLETFSGPPVGDRIFACHADGNIWNNRIENLRWGTPAENSFDMTSHGTKIFGSMSRASKLKESDVLAIRNEKYRYGLNAELARNYGVTKTLIGLIRKNKIWTHILPGGGASQNAIEVLISDVPHPNLEAKAG